MNGFPLKATYSNLYDRLIRGEEKIALVDLGYVGMPIAVEFAKHVNVIGFNHNEHRIQLYKSGFDPTNEDGNEDISKIAVDFTSDEKRLAEAKLIIVAVPPRLRMITSRPRSGIECQPYRRS